MPRSFKKTHTRNSFHQAVQGGQPFPLYLLVEFAVRFDLGHYQPNDAKVVDRCQGEEARAGGNVHIPRERVIDGKPILAQCSHLLEIVRAEKPELHIVR